MARDVLHSALDRSAVALLALSVAAGLLLGSALARGGDEARQAMETACAS